MKLLTVSLVLAISGLASATTVNTISKISVREGKQTTVITVKGSTKPSFTVFKLKDPIRIFVDVVNADVRKVNDAITVENGVIGQVGSLSVRNANTKIGRIIITMNRSNFYQVKADGHNIKIIIEATGRKKRGPSIILDSQRLQIKELDRKINHEKDILGKIRQAREKEEQLKKLAKQAREKEEQLKKQLEAERQKVEKLKLDAENARNLALNRKKKVEQELETQKQLKDATVLSRKKEEQRLKLLARLVQKKQEEKQALQKASDAEKAKIVALREQQQRLEERKKAAIVARQAEEARKGVLARQLKLAERKRLALKRARLSEEKLKRSLLTTRRGMEKKIRLLRLATRLELERQRVLREKRSREEARRNYLKTWLTKQKAIVAKLKAARRKRETSNVKKLELQISELKRLAKQRQNVDKQKLVVLSQQLAEKNKKLSATIISSQQHRKTLSRVLAEKSEMLKQARLANQQLVQLEKENKTVKTDLSTLDQRKKTAETSLQQKRLAETRSKQKLQEVIAKLKREREKVKQLKQERESLSQMAKLRSNEKSKLNKLIAKRNLQLKKQTKLQRKRLKLTLKAYSKQQLKIARTMTAVKKLMQQEKARYLKLVQLRKNEDKRIAEFETRLKSLRKLTKNAHVVAKKTRVEEQRLTKLREKVANESRKAEKLSNNLRHKRVALNLLNKMLVNYRQKIRALKKKGKRSAALQQSKRLKALKVKSGMMQLKFAVESKKLAELRRTMDTRKEKLTRLAGLYAERVAKLKGLDKDEKEKLARLKGLDKETRKRLGRLSNLKLLSQKKETEIKLKKGEIRGLSQRKQQLLSDLNRLKRQRSTEIDNLRKVAKTNGGVTTQLKRLKDLEKRLESKNAEVKLLLSKLADAKKVKHDVNEIPVLKVIKKGALAKVRGIKYKDTSEMTVITINTNEQANYKLVRQNGSQVLVLTGARIPKLLERSLDTSRRPSPVKLLSSFQDRKNKNVVRIVASMRKNVPSQVLVTPKGLKWIFQHNGKVLAKTPKKTSSPFMVVGPSPDIVKPKRTRVPTRVGSVKLSDITTITIDKKKRRYLGRKINLTVKDANIQHVLTFLAKEGRVNIIAGSDVRGSVTFHLEDVPWELAFEKILESKGLGYTREGNIITVRPLTKIAKEKELKVKTVKKQRELEPLKVRIVPVNYAKATELKQRLKTILSKRGKVEVDKRTNALIISDLEDHINAAIQLIRKLDLQTPQVLVETRIVEANIDFSRAVGIQWGGNLLFSQVTGNPTGLRFPSTLGIAGAGDDTSASTNGLFVNTPNFVVNMPAPIGAGSGGGLGLTFGSLGGTANLSLRLTAMEDKGFLKIISSPRITTLDQVAAKISQGVSIPISVVSAAGVSTVFHQAVLQLQVTPHVTQDGNIHLKIKVSKNEPDFGNTGARGDPTILTKQAETELLVKDGETSVIGGIYTRNVSRQTKKVPFFADIPVLGWFFRSKSVSDKRTEMLIFITPRIVNRGKSLLNP